MGRLQRIISRVSRAVVRRAPSEPGGRPLRARYDAAQTTHENRRHWANADSLDANSAASPIVRRTLRNRGRYEVANNCYVRGMVRTLAIDTIGVGPRLQMTTNDSVVNDEIEHAFGNWMKAARLPAKLRTMRKARATDGEAFALTIYNPHLKDPVKLDIFLLEADHFTTPTMGLSLDNSNQVDGIVFDAYGNPIEYHVLARHPGDTSVGINANLLRFAAESVIHWFSEERPGQKRGIPDLVAALEGCAKSRRYRDAVVAAAETAADHAMTIETEQPPDGEAAPLAALDLVDMEPRMATTLPAGWKLSQVKAEQPSTTYPEFSACQVGEQGRSINMPFNVATGNSSGYNFASGRLDYQTYGMDLKVERADIEDVILDPAFEAWYAEARLIEGYLSPAARSLQSRPHKYFWPARPHVDPAKEARAAISLRQAGLLSESDYYGERGLDWEEQQDQMEREWKRRDLKKLPHPWETKNGLPATTDADQVVEEIEENANAGR